MNKHNDNKHDEPTMSLEQLNKINTFSKHMVTIREVMAKLKKRSVMLHDDMDTCKNFAMEIEGVNAGGKGGGNVDYMMEFVTVTEQRLITYKRDLDSILILLKDFTSEITDMGEGVHDVRLGTWFKECQKYIELLSGETPTLH